jgi:hypothetical protein
MSFLFGVKKKEAPAPSAKDSIRTLREACEALEKRQAHLEKEASACHAKAKERMAAKDKRGTMFQLQMQKMKLKEVESSQGKMLNLMTMINQIETAVMSSGIAQAMQVGAQALTQLAQEANVEKIEQIMDSVQEATDDLNEVQEAMARPIAHFDEVLLVFIVIARHESWRFARALAILLLLYLITRLASLCAAFLSFASLIEHQSELDAEFAALEEEVEAEKLQSLHTPVALPVASRPQQRQVGVAAAVGSPNVMDEAPSAPVGRAVVAAKPVAMSKEEQELAALEAEFA